MAVDVSLPWSKYTRLPASPSPFALQEDRACPLSGSRREEELFSIDDFQFFDDQKGQNRIQHRVVYNPESGVVYTNPCYTPKGFGVLFEKAGQSYGHSEGRPQEQADWILGHTENIRSVCDIGCGSGAFLKTLPDNLNKVGVDVDLSSVHPSLLADPKVTFYGEDFNHFQLKQPVDLFTMFHVLEHLPSPLQTLKNLRKNAADNTYLLVEVPVIDLAAASPSEDMVGFFSVQHLTHFSKATLHCMLKQAGWDVVFTQVMEGYNGYRILAKPGTEENVLPTPAEKQSDKAAIETYMAQWRKNIKQVNQRVAALPPDANILIWGAGMHTEYLNRLTPLFTADRRYRIVDTDPKKDNSTYHGIQVVHPDKLPAGFWQDPEMFTVISSYSWQTEIHQALLAKGVPSSQIVLLYNTINRY